MVASCSDSDLQTEREKPQQETETTPDDIQKKPEDSQTDGGTVFVTFSNESSYAVNIFMNQVPQDDSSNSLLTIPSGKSRAVSLPLSQNHIGDAFYFEYLIPVGTVSFPYFSYENSQAYEIVPTDNRITIGELASCPTKSSYLLLENHAGMDISLINGNSILYHLSSKSPNIKDGESAVYLMGQNDEPIFYENTNLLKIQIGGNTTSLPHRSFALGSIYTFTVASDVCTLKSISPFDIDTERQIWAFDDSQFLADGTSRTVMRSQYGGQGFLIAGTVAPSLTASENPVYIGVKKVDFYGKQSEIFSAHFTHDATLSVTRSRVLDCLELSDGSVALLLENRWSEGGAEQYAHLLVRYHFETKSVLWSYLFPEAMLFRLDTRNFVISADDDAIFVAGGVVREDGMHLYAAKFSADGSLAAEYVSEDFSDYWGGGAESMLTSAYFDGTDFYVCGYENCDFQYSARIHHGIVYKFSADFSSREKIYDAENCIFSCIDGHGSEFYVCGEITESGNIQKGCFASSKMIAENKNPKSCLVQAKPYSWFSQLCFYDGMIVLCGTASEDQTGEKNPVPVVVAFDSAGTQIWENAGLSSYKNALSILPNKIGTYIIQMERTQGSAIHYASADLLGNMN